MFLLRIAEDWATRIAALRDGQTDDTNLIRFDNTHYRLCRPGPGTFTVKVLPVGGSPGDGIDLTFQTRDLYVTRIGNRLFERYASTLDLYAPQALGLSQAVHEVARAVGDRLFELQSLIVFCVAESLRNDQIATAVGQTVAATLGNPPLQGVPTVLPIAQWLPTARAWGQTSDAIFRALSAPAQEIVRKPRPALSVAERRFYERVDLARIPAHLMGYAKTIKVLRRPG